MMSKTCALNAGLGYRQVTLGVRAPCTKKTTPMLPQMRAQCPPQGKLRHSSLDMVDATICMSTELASSSSGMKG